MVNVRQVIFSLLASHPPLQVPIHEPPSQSHDLKSIAIVGAGSAGLAMLKTLFDLPESTRSTWKIVLFEERHSLGGIWLPDPSPAPPPEIPETPLYPLLRTNTPVPSMTYPGFLFPPGTPLYPSHEHIEAYHRRYASHYNLTSHIALNHTITETSWAGNADAGHWNVTYVDARGATRHENFNHLIVATGNNHFPRIPTWPGQTEWLANTPQNHPKREILHSAWYRGPKRYSGLRVLIVGGGSSGRDTAAQIKPLAAKTYISLRHQPDPSTGPSPEGVYLKADISHFTSNAVVFKDGTSSVVDVVLLGTGYEMRKPFLDKGGVLVTDRSAHSNESYPGKLVTNTQYIFPLHQHILSLSSSYPLNALAFIGLPSFIANCPSDIAQSLYVTHAILNEHLLPSRSDLLRDLAEHEQRLRRDGYDPYSIGHRLPPGTSSDYQDNLVSYLKEQGAIPDDGKKYVEEWRRDILSYGYLRRGWQRIESLGTQDEWLEGVETEEQWAKLMERVNRWQQEWESEQGIPFARDWDLAG
ncbi:Senecionine N-oxygenase [Hypsizygus marmoreus]|uniref:Senecionine N-oxygenase n=1 Tax=Hypsizygus marmoreus TaxID=39966 RepID=A0A369K9R2_HYPMA|nr:Senecionine N-oxygenase [Hypsizygus marmoreus]